MMIEFRMFEVNKNNITIFRIEMKNRNEKEIQVLKIKIIVETS